MAHMPRNELETSSHQTALAGKREGIRHFPSKLLEQIRNEARNKKHCCDKYGEELGSYFIFQLCKEDIKFGVILFRLEDSSLKKSFYNVFLAEKVLLNDIN